MFVLRLCTVLFVCHAMAQLVEALHYQPKVVGSVPNGVIGIFHLNDPSGCTMALRLIRSVARLGVGGLESAGRTPDTLSHFM
jgi:hypothetical protein